MTRKQRLPCGDIPERHRFCKDMEVRPYPVDGRIVLHSQLSRDHRPVDLPPRLDDEVRLTGRRHAGHPYNRKIGAHPLGTESEEVPTIIEKLRGSTEESVVRNTSVPTRGASSGLASQ